jgi:predicted  nucleic acid-binding Zn-ribbon protein
MPDRCTRTTTAFIALIAGFPLLSGCSDRDSDSRAIAESSRKLGSVGSATSAEDYALVSASISKNTPNGEAAAASSAGLLSLSLQGEGSVAINAATLGERALAGRLDSVMSMGRRFETLATTAAAMDAFDPAPDLGRIAAHVKRLESDANDQRSAREDLAGTIASLESRIASLSTESTAKRDRAAEMRLASASLSAVQAAGRAGEIRALSREADALEKQISALIGEAAALRPRLTEIDAEVNKLEQQRGLALDSADELREMASKRAARAETARAEASAIAEQIRAAVNAIDADRKETVIPSGEGATASLEKAVRESEKSARQLRSSGSLSKSAAQRRLGEMLQLRALGHARYAAMLENLAAIAGLPGASGYATAATEERASAAGLRDAAAEAYENAATSLTSVNIRGTDSDRAQATADGLRDLARLMRGETGGADTDADSPSEPAP